MGWGSLHCIVFSEFSLQTRVPSEAFVIICGRGRAGIGQRTEVRSLGSLAVITVCLSATGTALSPRPQAHTHTQTHTHTHSRIVFGIRVLWHTHTHTRQAHTPTQTVTELTTVNDSASIPQSSLISQLESSLALRLRITIIK